MYPVIVIKNYGNCVSLPAITLNVISAKGPKGNSTTWFILGSFSEFSVFCHALKAQKVWFKFNTNADYEIST